MDRDSQWGKSNMEISLLLISIKDFTDDDEVMKLIDQFLQIQIDIDALDARLAVDTQEYVCLFVV